MLGFGMMAVTFGLLALIPNLEKMAVRFLMIHGFSFFFTELGPNATSFAYSSEIFRCGCELRGMGMRRRWASWADLLGCLFFLT